ncbi:protein dispatched homolog 1 isoform X1 [Lingula anatina]|uniref:Protein dispatched homolog 1 isoform X1 n=1 Tax=Lingula anatina TaxID=7574 RepID=A0A1S3H8N2_LINAN|nr:protein dispatched homolog 1 isoform X1 [Lingula anatina]|eukprot:XP_013381836.1 protein dispatched homolog 1 isoform X1 [Lingula anatina]
MPYCYSRLLAQHPYVVVILGFVVTASCLAVVVTIANKPNFSDPKAGFEPRGTEISARAISWQQLVDATGLDAESTLTPFPRLTIQDPSSHFHSVSGGYKNTSRSRRSGRDHGQTSSLTFCDDPRKEYAHFAYRSVSGESLFTSHSIHAMCHLEEHLVQLQADFVHNCVKQDTQEKEEDCCFSWTLGNYIALLSEKPSCYDVTQDDIIAVLSTLQRCAGFFKNATLTSDCASRQELHCQDLPPECTANNAVYQLFHFILDRDFSTAILQNQSEIPTLKYVMTFLPVARGPNLMQLYKKMERSETSMGDVEVFAIDFGIKYAMFDNYLVTDTLYLGLASLVIFLVLWLYTSSIFITFMTLITIIITLLISYFIYTIVFDIQFFPFMNLLTVVILLGIGADDLLIYSKIWIMSKSEKNNGTLEKIVKDTLHHASVSMFVTSLTTAGAFYASYVSNITAIRCFAIYAGTSILIAFFLMVTIIPACIVIHEKWMSDCWSCYDPDAYMPKKTVCYYLCRIPYKVHYLITDWSRIFFEKLLPCIVVKLRYFWIVIFTGFGICGIVVIFYKPKLRIPSTAEFHVFSADNPMEIYDTHVKQKFWFETSDLNHISNMPLTFVWGVVPKDNGNRLDPHDRGSLEYDKTFNPATPVAQRWLLQFCRKLRETTFYQGFGFEIMNCFSEQFHGQLFMERPCTGDLGESHVPCCSETIFPYPDEVYIDCVNQYMDTMRGDPVYSRLYSKAVPGPRYEKGNPRMKALIIEFNGNTPYSFSYSSINSFYNNVSDWFRKQMESAPVEMSGGYFTSDLQFYDLQDSLSNGIPKTLIISLSIATAVMFLTTLNILITVYALISIIWTISMSLGILVLLGWELNILESLTVSIAVGLSIDYTLHYGVSYRLAGEMERELRVVYSLAQMGPPLSMAACTSFLAGGLMLPSTVLAYKQIGTFLMVIMSSSWLCSTLFFQSVLRAVGPQGNFGQFRCPDVQCCSSGIPHPQHKDKTRYLQVGSPQHSSTNPTSTSETHEMEPLTWKSHQSQHAPSPRLATHTSTGYISPKLLTVKQCQEQAAGRVARSRRTMDDDKNGKKAYSINKNLLIQTNSPKPKISVKVLNPNGSFETRVQDSV